MTLQYPLIDVTRAAALDTSGHPGWSVSEFRVPVSGREGSTSSASFARLAPGDSIGKIVNPNADEIVFHASGGGVAGLGDGRSLIRAGHCRLIAKGSEHFFKNTSESEDAVIVSFHIGDADVTPAMYETTGEITDADLVVTDATDATDGTDGAAAAVVHLDDVEPENMSQGDGWMISDFRLPISGRNGSASTLFRARFMPGAVHKKHRHENCEEIYHILSGHGLAGAGDDRVEMTSGHFHYIPKDVEHWLHNLSPSQPIEVIGVYVNAASVAETGYTYTGDVTNADINAERTT